MKTYCYIFLFGLLACQPNSTSAIAAETDTPMEISSEAYMKEFGGRYNVLMTCPLYEANFDFFEKTINRNGHEYCNISKITSIRSNKEILLNLTKCETEAIPIEDKVVSLKYGDADTIIIDGWNGGPLVLYPCPSYPTQN